MPKGSDLLVAALENEGVDRIFGVPGEENLDVVESLRNSKIQLVLTRHEQAAAFMAATHGRLTGRPGVCISTLGPGALNLSTGAAYAQLGAMRAGFEVFRSFEQDAKDFAEFAQTKLTMPMLVLTGEKASGEFLIQQARLVDTNVDGVVIKGKGHWLIDEAPQEVIPRLVAFISKSQ